MPLAVGHAFATEYRRKLMKEDRDDIGLVIMGDGSVQDLSEGEFTKTPKANDP